MNWECWTLTAIVATLWIVVAVAGFAALLLSRRHDDIDERTPHD